jgi:molybdopterin-binding protein
VADVVTLPALDQPIGGERRLRLGPLEVAAGERLVLFGPNGAGKTTALRSWAGTLPSPVAVASTYLPQRVHPFRGSARRNLHMGLDAEAQVRAERLSARLGLDTVMDRPASALSGGERQRLGLARTLARPERLVLLDEPLAAVDRRDREMVEAAIIEALDRRAAVIVTHDREVAAVLAHRVGVVIDGEIRQLGDVSTVFTLPDDDDVAAVVGIGNVVTGRVVAVEGALAAVDVDGVTLWGMGDHAPDQTVTVLFGAETVTVYPGAAAPGSARNLWAGVVTQVRSTGRLVELLVDVGFPVAALITPGSLEALRLDVGGVVSLAVKATAVRVVGPPP